MAKYLFIAGAPRSGTTFLMQTLSQHPDISASIAGASYYFMDANHPIPNKKSYHTDGIAGYMDCFKEKPSSIYLDGTDHLMYQLSMIPVLQQMGDCKFIIILREPAARIYSSFFYTKNNLGNFNEDISFTDYVKALLADEKDLISSWMTKNTMSAYILPREFEYSHYHIYIEKWMKAFGRENFIFVSFDRMVKNKNIVIDKITEQLYLPFFEIQEENKNESYSIKNIGIHRKIMSLSKFVPSSGVKTLLGNFYLKFQKNKNEMKEEDKVVIEELKKEFILSNKKIEEIIGFSL